MPQTTSRLSIGDIELSYIERGNRSDTPIIFVPGYTDSCLSFEPVMARLSGRYHVLAFSQRGHGDSDKPATGYTLDQLGTDLVAFMNALDLPRAFIVGHSLGTLVALRVGADHPGRVLGLGLLGAMKTLAGNPAAEELWSDDVRHIEGVAEPDFVRAFQESTLAQPVSPAWLELVVAESCKVPGVVWRDLLRSALDDDRNIDFARIMPPALVVWGDRDGFTQLEEQASMAAAMPRGELRVVADAGHAVHWEQPQETATMLAEFFASASFDEVSNA